MSAAAGTAVSPHRPFVTALRTPPGEVSTVGSAAGERITIRVQFEPLWDAVAFDVPAGEPTETVVRAALARFGAGAVPSSEFVVKLRGWEIADLSEPLADAGTRNGSTLLVSHRYRRPVR